ncbi:MAG: glycosyltransferase family 4 protein [Planctomycetota bacterium]|nr:glycosyltransferase family 4 protein [Planctomycetota bacterium]
MSLRFVNDVRPTQRPLPICHVQVLPLMTGVQRAMLEIFAHLDRTVFAPSVVCQAEGPLTDELQRLEIPFHTIPSLDRPIHPLRDLKAYRELKRYFVEQRFAVVHTHSSKPGIVGRLAASRAGVPLVVHHVQGFAFHEFSSRRKTWLFSRAEKWAGRHSDKVVFVNDEERRTAVEQGWLPAEKTVTIYNGVNLDELDAGRHAESRARFRARHQLAEHDVAVVVLGRLDLQKQSMIVPKIARELETLQPDPNWRILMAGEGELHQQLRQELAASGLGNRVSLIGWQEQPVEAVMGSDIVMLPSLWEGLPLSLLEAHAAGKPTVASDVKGNREVVTSRTGFLCSPRDPENYALALSRLISDAALRARLGIAARSRAEAEFDSAANSRRVIELYESMLGVTQDARKLAA